MIYLDSGSDTEFEDELMMIPRIQEDYNDLEELRMNLEKKLGSEKCIKMYKEIEVKLKIINIIVSS